jgi:hypothetical protein
VNGDFERVWEESVVAYFKIISQHLPAGTEKNNNKPPVRIICVPGGVRTGFSPRASQKRRLSRQLAVGGSSEDADVKSGYFENIESFD